MTIRKPIHLLQFGAEGQLGQELTRIAAGDKTIHHTVLSFEQVNFTRPDEITDAVQAAPALDAVVNAAAYTAVDRAESEPELAQAINGLAVGRLAEACADRDVPLIHISTDYVYDGAKSSPYVESDATGPLNVYGRTKLAGEDLIRACLPTHVILRTSWIFSAHGANFVKTMLRLGAERDELRIVDDQKGAPTSAADLARAIMTIVPILIAPGEPSRFGTFHFANQGETSWWQFAEEIFRQAPWAGIRTRVVPIAAADYPTPARRPANSRLDTAKIRDTFGIAPPPWQQSLAAVLADLWQGCRA
jgi:dTDP-4-dehydrorhamnose reductase